MEVSVLTLALKNDLQCLTNAVSNKMKMLFVTVRGTCIQNSLADIFDFCVTSNASLLNIMYEKNTL